MANTKGVTLPPPPGQYRKRRGLRNTILPTDQRIANLERRAATGDARAKAKLDRARRARAVDTEAGVQYRNPATPTDRTITPGSPRSSVTSLMPRPPRGSTRGKRKGS